MKLIFLHAFYFTFTFSFSQSLHHQMISSQGGTNTTNSGIIVKHTTGQQSIIGTKSGQIIVQQGFQQSYWDGLIASNNTIIINTITFPNPYIDVIHFQFSQPIGDQVSLLVFDALGRQVYSNNLQVFENEIVVNLQELQSAEYFVYLSNSMYSHFTKIIKN